MAFLFNRHIFSIKTQGYVMEGLKSSLRKFYSLVHQYEVPLSRMLKDIIEHDHMQWHPPSLRNYAIYDLVTEHDLVRGWTIISTLPILVVISISYAYEILGFNPTIGKLMKVFRS